jgi:DnaJ-domain-containing protein 1
MYDRLGDLLSSALESGEIPRKTDPEISVPAPERKKPDSSVKERRKTTGTRIIFGKKDIRKGEVIHAYQSTVSLPDYVARSYAVLGIKENATEEQIRNAYRSKLKIFHPDSNAGNGTIQKIALQKTSEIIEAYKTVKDWTARRQKQ